MISTRRAVLAVVGTVIGVLSLVVGCSSTKEASGPTTAVGSAAGTPITADEASKLADALVNNHTVGGAHVHATIPFGTATFELDGEIDWVGHVGRLTATSTITGQPARAPFDIVFNPNVTFETVPGLEEALGAKGRPGISWVARPLDPASSPLHLPLRLIDTAASTTRDNPILLQQDGVTALGPDLVGDVATHRFDRGRTTIWLGDTDGLTHRIDAELQATRSTATFVFTDFGPRTITVPADVQIVSVDEISELYRTLVAAR